MNNLMMTEQQVLDKIGIPDFRHITKDNLITFASMIQDIDPEVAKEAIKQFPDFGKMISSIAEDYKMTTIELSKNNQEIAKACLEILNSIIESLQKYADKEKISYEERRFCIDQMMVVAQKVDDIDRRNRESAVQTQFLVTIATIILGAFASAILGANFKFKPVI